MPLRRATLALVFAACAAARAQAQGLPSEPVSLGDGRVVIGAEVTATIASSDPGFFNYTEYEYSALRNFRLGVSAEVRANARLQVLAEVRMDHGEMFQPFALYARIRPWPERRLDIQIGRVPPTFGSFARNAYGTGNLLIGTPLAYQYLTSLRPDALPITADDLIRMRGRGWLSRFPRGSTADDRGLPIINSFRWDTGVQVHGVNGIVAWTGSITTGSLSNPRVDDDNDGRHFAGRIVVRPMAAVAAGVSLSRGAFLSENLASVLPAGRQVEEGTQDAIGADVEYSAGRFLSRAEVIRSVWHLPMTSDVRADYALAATSTLGEARYRLFPGIHVAARAERLDFSDVGTTTMASWDAPVRRYEVGAGWSVIRNIMIKASWQRNYRDGGRVRRDTIGAAQIVYWF